MKKTLLTITCFFTYIISIQAQTLYGSTPIGGNDGAGTIDEFIPATGDLIVHKSFESIAYHPASTSSLVAANSKLYGMTSMGGRYGYGAIFSLDPVTSAYTKLKDFDNTNGSYPLGSLMQASDGKLYGMTSAGGSTGYGLIFSFDPVTLIYTDLADFNNTNGANPSGSLVQATDGKLYGMTDRGGSNGVGVIFSYDISTSPHTYAKLKDLDNAGGASPYGSLVQASSDGKLYGMTSAGGSNGVGVIFSFDISTSTPTYAKLRDFNTASGATPYGSLMQASDRKLYGMTNVGGSNGDGVFFSFDPVSLSYTDLNDFHKSGTDTNGGNPYGGVIQGSDGKLYGTTNGGNVFDNADGADGLIFSFDIPSLTFTRLFAFSLDTDGDSPSGSPVQASDGKLYGITAYGGDAHTGIIFSFDPSLSAYSIVTNFSNTKGDNPNGLMQGVDKKLYSMTKTGGSSNAGVIFSFDATSFNYSDLKDFGGASYHNSDGYYSGAFPNGNNLVQARNGLFYGMTTQGGGDLAIEFLGVIFSFDAGTSTYTVLKDFDGFFGSAPTGSLIQASDDKLYGMTPYGGNGVGNSGVIFSIDPITLTKTKLYDFDMPNGGNPFGSLAEGPDHKLYGMTSAGGSNNLGVIFSLDPITLTYTKLKDFDNTSGANPYGSLFLSTDGKFYGMTYGGGTGGYGVIFSYDPALGTYVVLKDFNQVDGANPYGNLMQRSDGKFYGMTYAGGNNNLGVIFSYDPVSLVYMKLQDYDGANGANPYLGSVFVEVQSGGTLPVLLLSFTGKNNGNSNQLSWQVENEQDLNYYELQRSDDGQVFKNISQINADGNHSYTYSDNIARTSSSTYYYRLKSVDKDGNFKYSAVIKLRTVPDGFVEVAPNPFKNKLVINIESLIRDKATFIITDANGRRLYKENKILSVGTNVIEINETDKFPKGIYLLTIINSLQTQSFKVVKGN